ncbi:hypothetical protein [Streptomyces sp. YIM 98790]|uniref:hypothetical protein n=1 Tax=Streptomyces sp. YIM 98790 TaxID=2689077 RepID=UPI00140B2634|nr:hypothetical protein [Streptomyces sp. YIM 98790]
MSLAPRAVLVHRTTEYEELLARHGTHGQAEFFLRTHGQDLAGVEERHRRAKQILAQVTAAVPATWRQARVERADLDRFLFAPEDVVVVVGADGLVANTAKYLAGQPVLGIDTDPGRNPGVLVRHRAERAATLLRAAPSPRATVDELTMVEAVTDDTQRLLALNEIYVGQPGHQTARYLLRPQDRGPGGEERQASSGVVAGTGTGATGWLRSLAQQRGSDAPPLPEPGERRVAWFVREAWASPTTGTSRVAGVLAAGELLRITIESDRLVVFGDGMETDTLQVTRGQTVRLGVADTALRLLE